MDDATNNLEKCFRNGEELGSHLTSPQGNSTLQRREEDHRRVEKRLGEEFKRIKSLIQIDLDFRIIWAPRSDKNQLGEVQGKSIVIYEADEEEAIKVLRHEVIDYVVCKAIKSYQEMTNMLIKKFNEEAYQNKEKMVNSLTKLLD